MLRAFFRNPDGIPFDEPIAENVAEAVQTDAALGAKDGSMLVDLYSGRVMARKEGGVWRPLPWAEEEASGSGRVAIDELPELEEPALGDENYGLRRAG